MSDFEYLVLDLKLYPGASRLKEALTVIQNKTNHIVMELDQSSMTDAEWDEVLDNLLRAKKCITL